VPKAPPSLSSISGLTHWQVEEEDRRRRLEQVLCGLPLRPEAASKIADLARNLDKAFLFARVATAAKHKTRSASLSNMKRQLRYIESRANTLAKRLARRSRAPRRDRASKQLMAPPNEVASPIDG
jgi:hypothetical protein